MTYTNNNTDIGIELGHLCVTGSGESVIGAFDEAAMNAVFPTTQAGGNVSCANIGWHVENDNKHHVFLSLGYGYDAWKGIAQEIQKKNGIAPQF